MWDDEDDLAYAYEQVDSGLVSTLMWDDSPLVLEYDLQVKDPTPQEWEFVRENYAEEV